jgi:hypothetical protein
MDGAYDMYEREERCLQEFGGGNLQWKEQLEDLGVDGG